MHNTSENQVVKTKATITHDKALCFLKTAFHTTGFLR
jgi:hypothetical protein